MGLPQINIIFSSRAVSAIQRSALGIVALIVRDETNPALTSPVTVQGVDNLRTEDWTAENYDYISKTLLGVPSKVLVFKIGTDDELTDVLAQLANTKFNFMAMPGATTAEAEQISTWVKGQRTNRKKTVKAVVANQAADSIGVVNFTTEDIVTATKTYTAQEYTGRIAGILAGLPFSRSATYYELPEVTSVAVYPDADAAIDNGELILFNDGERIKIGRGVNSLTTVTADMKQSWKKIKVVDVMDLILDDIRDTFQNEYVGKVQNTTDNQYLFITAVRSYFTGLAAQSILDPNYNNTADIDVTSQRLAWESIGTDTSALDDSQIRNMPFESWVYLRGAVKVVDSLEDINFIIDIV